MNDSSPREKRSVFRPDDFLHTVLSDDKCALEDGVMLIVHGVPVRWDGNARFARRVQARSEWILEDGYCHAFFDRPRVVNKRITHFHWMLGGRRRNVGTRERFALNTAPPL